ncbi:MAG: MFS transporter, partial [Chloroflexales bacterium]|nr:MFS transporter [Chloroflexales bacterium]
MARTVNQAAQTSALRPRDILMPLVLAQFLCSFAGSTMNVAISDIAGDLATTVSGVQTAITAFTLTMAALMIPGGKVTDIWGRKACFRLGLLVYGAGALLAAVSQGLPGLIAGYSIGQGLGTALLIPPVYILATVLFPDLKARAGAFGAISAAGGVGAAAGPLIGGLIASVATWRVNFVLQALIAVLIIFLGRRITDPGVQGAKPRLDIVGTILSAAGLFFIVIGILQISTYGWLRAKQDFAIGGTVLIPQGGISPVVVFVLIGALLLAWFFWHVRSMERAGKEPLLPLRLFKNR